MQHESTITHTCRNRGTCDHHGSVQQRDSYLLDSISHEHLEGLAYFPSPSVIIPFSWSSLRTKNDNKFTIWETKYGLLKIQHSQTNPIYLFIYLFIYLLQFLAYKQQTTYEKTTLNYISRPLNAFGLPLDNATASEWWQNGSQQQAKNYPNADTS